MNACIIGAGRMGLNHLRVVRELGLEVVGVSDLRESALATAADAGVPQDHLYTDAAAMLRTTAPSVVVVATTAPSHAMLVSLALQHASPRYILCEKPMACSLGEAKEMIRCCRERGVHLAINHQMRFMEQYTRVKSLLATEGFGPLSSVTVVAGNFGLAMNGSHYFEMFRYLSDAPITSLSAWFDSTTVANPRGAAFVDRSGCVRAVTDSGKRFYMDASGGQGHGLRVTYAARNGQITVDELEGKVWVAVRRPEHAQEATTRYGMPWTYREETIAPADSIAPTKATLAALLAEDGYPSGEDGLHAVQALVAAYRSDADGGRTVSMAEVAESEEVFPWA